MFTRTLLLLLLLWGQDATCIVRVVEMRAPAHGREGGTAVLSCAYELVDDELYSLKWSKDHVDFYRYVPRESSSFTAFDHPGLHVDLTKSTSNVVVLKNLSRESEGYYACEVTGEAPSFATVRSSKYITIHLLPDSGPHVTGTREQYYLDEQAEINCTSSASRPAAQLAWLINERPAPSHDIQGPWFQRAAGRQDAVETTLQLRFTVAPRHFQGSTMTLRCQATIAPMYHRETSSTHSIGLPYTLLSDRSPDSPDPDTSSSVSKLTKAGLLAFAVLLLILL